MRHCSNSTMSFGIREAERGSNIHRDRMIVKNSRLYYQNSIDHVMTINQYQISSPGCENIDWHFEIVDYKDCY